MPFRYAELEKSIVDTVREAVEGRDVAVAFSGGLDSGLISAIAGKYADSVHLYTCGTEKSHDVAMAGELAEKLGLPWTHVEISKRNVEPLIKEMASATGTVDPFTISYELQLFCVCREAKEGTVLTGQGADEYFGGCAKFVGKTDNDYALLRDDAVDRLLNVSVPCELSIARHYSKELFYPYLSENVITQIGKLDERELRPRDMDSRKAVLREIAENMGFPLIAARKKKSSQYGSGTTDVIRALSRDRGMFFNEYVSTVCNEALFGDPGNEGDAFVTARMDSILKREAETVLARIGKSPSEAVGMLYRKIVEDGNLQSVEKRG